MRSQVDRDLIAAARFTERYCLTEAPTVHLLDCVRLSLGMAPPADARRRYHACATRLFSCIGTDLADFDKDEAVDMLVAASYWKGAR